MKLIAGIDEVGEMQCLDTFSSKFVIYGLFDPRSGELRYIGKSQSGLKRAKCHATQADLKRHGKTHKTAWVKSLLKLGIKPTFGVIAEYETLEVLYEEEQRWIKHYKELGARLTNATDGGPGRIGYHLSEETKEKIRKARKYQKPVKHSKETKVGLRKLQLGRVHSEAIRIRMAKAHGARPFREVTSGLIFESQSQAARAFKISQPAVRRVLTGERKTTHGRVFKYL